MRLRTITILLIVMLTPMSIMADNKLGGTQEDIISGSKVEIKVTPTILSVEMPLDTTFVIGDNSIYPDINIVNNSTAPIEIIVDKVTRKSDKTPFLLRPSNYSNDEWEKLSVEETQKGIALGINKKDVEDFETVWFVLNYESNMGRIEPLSNQIYNLTAKYGRQWVENIDLNYELHITVRLSEQ